jgi:polysaccharide pyruvyl transferase WcaK-like protein
VKALVLWGNDASSNLGVRALGAGTEALMRRVDPSVEFRHQGYGPGDAPVRIGVARSHVRRLVRDTDGLIDWVKEFDVVLDTRAGDSFADIYGVPRLLSMNLMNEIVHRAKVPVVFTPQTIGPFTTTRGRLLGRRAVHKAAAVMARDHSSANVAASLGRPVDVLSTDVVFAIDPATPAGDHDVLLNVSGLLWVPNPHVDHRLYRRFVIRLCRGLLDTGRKVTLLSHVIESPNADNDVPASREVAELLGDTGPGCPEVLVPESLDDVRQEIASANLVIGSRMHACLNALSLGVPAIPLAYSRKFAPLLHALEWTAGIDLRQPDDEMVSRVLAAASDPDLNHQAKLVRDRAQELLAPVAEVLERVVSARAAV